MTTPELNTDRLTAVLEHIEQHPEQHDQESWSMRTDCGTTACAAGWTVLLYAPNEQFAYYVHGVSSEAADYLMSGEDIPCLARRLLGLNYDEVQALFYGARTTEDTLLTGKRILAGEYR
jgi:hypothetical protein